MQSINFNDNENISRDDSATDLKNSTEIKKTSIKEKSKEEIEMKIKNEQLNKIENVSIYHLITNYRFVNNLLQSLLTNA